MHQLARYCAGWVSATALATGVSWVAIDSVVSTAALSQPLAAPAERSSSPDPSSESSVPSPTPTTQAPPSPPAPTSSPDVAVTTPAPRVTKARPRPTPSPSLSPSSSAQGYSMKGGQVLLDLRADSAKLVSAVPAAGYTTESWTTDYWLRVDFVKGERRSSMIVSWYQHAPTVQQTET